MNAVEQLQQSREAALQAAIDQAGEVEAARSKHPFRNAKDKANGDFATNVTMQCSEQPPCNCESILKTYKLKEQISKNRHRNLEFPKHYCSQDFSSVVKAAFEQGENYGRSKAGAARKYKLSSYPNTTVTSI